MSIQDSGYICQYTTVSDELTRKAGDSGIDIFEKNAQQKSLDREGNESGGTDRHRCFKQW